MAANTFESNFGGVSLQGQAHPLSAWFVLALRVMMGYIFIHAGLEKILGGFDASGYLLHAVPAASPAVGLFHWMAGSPAMLGMVNVAVPFGELFIGLGVLFGALTRLAAFFGAVMMVLLYFSNWAVENGMVNSDFAYIVVFLVIAALGAGRIIGLDAYLEETQFVKDHPRLRLLLG